MLGGGNDVWVQKDTCFSLPLRMIGRLTMRWNHFAFWTFTSMSHFNATAMGENSSIICCRCHLSFHHSIQNRDQRPLCADPTQRPCLPPSCLPCSHVLLFPSQAAGFLLACSPPTFSYPESPVPCRRSELNHTNWPLTDPHRSCLSS